MKTVMGIALALLLGGIAPAIAADMAATNAWARATSPDNRIGIAFVTLTNTGVADDTLTSAATPVAGRVEFHSHVHQDGLMKMRQQDRVTVAAGQSLTFSPSGLHLMLQDLKGQLKPGQTFPLTLTFARAGGIAVTVAVEGAGAMDHSRPMDPSRHDEHMKDPEHKAMHDRMHGPAK